MDAVLRMDAESTFSAASGPPTFRLVAPSDLTWNSTTKSLWLIGQQSLSQLNLATIWRTDQGNGPLVAGRLVVQRHLFVGQDLLIDVLWQGKLVNFRLDNRMAL